MIDVAPHCRRCAQPVTFTQLGLVHGYLFGHIYFCTKCSVADRRRFPVYLAERHVLMGLPFPGVLLALGFAMRCIHEPRPS